jgi:hypothetical protein
MNEEVAYFINAELHRLRKLPYSELAALIGKQPETNEAVGGDGRVYQLEIMAFWDSKKGKDVRLIVAADDGGPRACHPVTGDFIMRPDGTFVGESAG